MDLKNVTKGIVDVVNGQAEVVSAFSETDTNTFSG
jgi:hypothetical protein